MRTLLLIALLVLPAFFAAAEVSLLRLRPSRVHELREEGQPGAPAVERLQRRLRTALLMTQFGTTLSLVALGWIAKGFGQRWWPMDTPAVVGGIWPGSLCWWSWPRCCLGCSHGRWSSAVLSRQPCNCLRCWKPPCRCCVPCCLPGGHRLTPATSCGLEASLGCPCAGTHSR